MAPFLKHYLVMPKGDGRLVYMTEKKAHGAGWAPICFVNRAGIDVFRPECVDEMAQLIVRRVT